VHVVELNLGADPGGFSLSGNAAEANAWIW
jgi:hypothetical protein